MPDRIACLATGPPPCCCITNLHTYRSQQLNLARKLDSSAGEIATLRTRRPDFV